MKDYNSLYCYKLTFPPFLYCASNSFWHVWNTVSISTPIHLSHPELPTEWNSQTKDKPSKCSIRLTGFQLDYFRLRVCHALWISLPEDSANNQIGNSTVVAAKDLPSPILRNYDSKPATRRPHFGGSEGALASWYSFFRGILQPLLLKTHHIRHRCPTPFH
jgi:hypothetical protein